MTNSAMAFLEQQQQQQQQRQQRQSKPPPHHDYPVGAEEEDMDIQSDLVPSANTFIRKLYQMVTSENHDIISFTEGTFFFFLPRVVVVVIVAGCGAPAPLFKMC